MRLIAFLLPGDEARGRRFREVFLSELSKLGHREGRDIAFWARFADGNPERFPPLVAEALKLNPAVIVTASSEGVSAFKKATSTVPVVFATAADPVEQGFIASFRRPGGNITGITLHSDLDRKIVEVIREALPSARRLAVLLHEPDRYHRIVLSSFEPAAKQLKFETMAVRVSVVADLEGAFKEMTNGKADAVYTPTLSFLNVVQPRLVELAMKARLPHFSSNPEFAASGALLAYGTALEENFQRVAVMVDKILRGANPADMPVQQPERFQLIVNRKTAKAIGIELSAVTMLRADKIIE